MRTSNAFKRESWCLLANSSCIVSYLYLYYCIYIFNLSIFNKKMTPVNLMYHTTRRNTMLVKHRRALIAGAESKHSQWCWQYWKYLIEVYAKSEMSKRGWKGFYWLIEVKTKSEMSDRRWKWVCWLIKEISKLKVGDGLWKSINWLIEFTLTYKSEVIEKRWKTIHWMIKTIS